MSINQLLTDAEDAWAEGDLSQAERLIDQALLENSKSIDALEMRANLLAEQGLIDDAIDAFRALLTLAPKDVPIHLAAADVLIRNAEGDRELIDEGLDLLDRIQGRASNEPELLTELHVLRGIALNQLGEPAEGLRALEAALKAQPDHAEARLEAAMARFELGQFSRALADLRGLVADYPDDPWAHHALGLVLERTDPPRAQGAFDKARAIDAEAFPAPISLSIDEFNALVQQAIGGIPEHAKAHLDNVVIDVQSIPGDDDVREGVSPTILGIFRGTPIDERSPVVSEHHETARISLFQKNLERSVRSRDELIEEIRITVLHEVGHLLGLDEDELAERGLD